MKKHRIKTGHRPKRSGAGPHQDKRTKRKRSRSDAKRAAIKYEQAAE